jgi:hypothetical protein
MVKKDRFEKLGDLIVVGLVLAAMAALVAFLYVFVF